jgi:hypothetical protein
LAVRPIRQEERPTKVEDLANFFGSHEEEEGGEDSPGGIVGLFETISKLHSDTGSNFQVTRHQATSQTPPEEDNGELREVRSRKTNNVYLLNFALY